MVTYKERRTWIQREQSVGIVWFWWSSYHCTSNADEGLQIIRTAFGCISIRNSYSNCLISIITRQGAFALIIADVDVPMVRIHLKHTWYSIIQFNGKGYNLV